jgi:hypothetical protein
MAFDDLEQRLLGHLGGAPLGQDGSFGDSRFVGAHEQRHARRAHSGATQVDAEHPAFCARN